MISGHLDQSSTRSSKSGTGSFSPWARAPIERRNACEEGPGQVRVCGMPYLRNRSPVARAAIARKCFCHFILAPPTRGGAPTRKLQDFAAIGGFPTGILLREMRMGGARGGAQSFDNASCLICRCMSESSRHSTKRAFPCA